VVDVGNDREIADVIHAEGEPIAGRVECAAAADRCVRVIVWMQMQDPLMTRTTSSVSGTCVEDKKKARRMSDAPSNKTYGNCLLGLHCIQKTPAGAAPLLDFLSLHVANKKSCPQLVHKPLWSVWG
jgi:hypothetical protein